MASRPDGGPAPFRRSNRSAGLLAWRRGPDGPQFLLAHPGGPFWARKDAGAWTIPKGLIEAGEDALAAARREFVEEIGLEVDGDFTQLAPLKQKGGKTVLAWLVEADLDLARFRSNTFELEWPPRSGRRIEVPECDRAEYFAPPAAMAKILQGQLGFLEEAMALTAR
ncbi:MAG TPA: NUDIX domain-containing protein [Caulobacteraceae bacterium]|nr:NUDIX domain-containing protein [Caulobacteraceae bacterium]